ncbi:hypothetical protein BJX70DRAFT_107736 [Aspergillus crustosus]
MPDGACCTYILNSALSPMCLIDKTEVLNPTTRAQDRKCQLLVRTTDLKVNNLRYKFLLSDSPYPTRLTPRRNSESRTMKTELDELVEFLHHGNTQIRQIGNESKTYLQLILTFLSL